MKKSLAIGVDYFEELIKGGCYYVDKTEIIEELVGNKSKVKLFPRPRRFGKTITMSMIDCYFNIDRKEETETLFEGLYIENCELARIEKSKYPVIMLNFKGVKADNWKDLYEEIKIVISELYEQFSKVKGKLNPRELKKYEQIESRKAEEVDYKYSLVNLTKYMERYYKEKVIVLVDEYDAPIDNAYNKGYYDEAIKFFKGMYTQCLKTNASLHFSVITGVVRVSSESMFSDLNNLTVYGIMDNDFNEYFGFTEEEVINILKYYELEQNLEDVKTWYNGYKFGDLNIYNPWSILNYASRKRLDTYWVNTGENTLLKRILNSGYSNVKTQITKLLDGEEIKATINEKISYKDLNNSEELALTMLLLTGYLTSVDVVKEGFQKYNILKIPNEEVKMEFARLVNVWLNNEGITNYMERFKAAVITEDARDMEETLNEMLFKSVSFQDEPEQLYHGIVLCMLIHFGNNYIIKSNREAGYGRYDITVEAKDRFVWSSARV